MISYGWLMIIILIVAAVIVRRYLRTPSGRLWWHTTQMKIPLVREMVMAGAFTRFAQTLGMLIGNGVSVLEALRISERTIQNAVLAQEIKNARERVTDGATISGPLAAGKVFPPMLTDMLAIGEETGDMAGALAHIARRYENMLDRSVKIFTTLLEPILIVIMASLVGFVAISILLAVFDVTSGLNV
jgi:type II secretory pathway component PulF